MIFRLMFQFVVDGKISRVFSSWTKYVSLGKLRMVGVNILNNLNEKILWIIFREIKNHHLIRSNLDEAICMMCKYIVFQLLYIM